MGGPYTPPSGQLAGEARLRGLIDELKAAQPELSVATAPPSGLSFLDPPDRPHFIGRLGPYPIAGLIGQGAMGLVLKGLDTALNRIVAIKVLNPHVAADPTARQRFLREAQAAAAVVHDHVVTIHAVDEANGVPFLVMEYIVGVSLEDRIQRSGMLRVEESLRIGMQAASGLAAAHALGLVHRDIKPANILLENGVERVKITDFGLARAAHDVQITGDGAVLGTPQYMSPEQARGEVVDQRSDLFSLGCVLYTMCTGRSPFRADTALAAIRRVCQDTPRPIREVNPQVPEWLAELINRLLAKDPAERFQTAAAVAQTLGQFLAHVQQPLHLPPPTLPQPTVRPGKKARGLPRWTTRAVLACLAAGLLAMVGLQLVPDRDATVSSGGKTPPSPSVPDRFMHVDLQPQATCRLAEPTDHPANHLGQIEPGIHILDGVSWRIGPRYIHLAGKDCPQFPRGVQAIAVEQSANRLHFLHALQWANPTVPKGTKVAQYVIHYADATTKEVPVQVPVRYGVEAEEWWAQKPTPAADAPVAWFGSNEAARSRGYSVNLVHFSWTNLQPDKRIARIDFLKPVESAASALCLAITCETTAEQSVQPYAAARGILPVNVADDLVLTLRGDDEQATCVGSKSTELLLQPGTYRLQVSQREAVKRTGTLVVAQGNNAGVTLGKEFASGPPREPQPASEWELPNPVPLWSVAFSHAGDWLALGGDKGVAKLVRASKSTPSAGQTLSGHSKCVRACAFSPDDQLLATASEDGDVRFWETATGKLVATLRVHESGVYWVAFSPDGTTLATSCGNGTVKLWDAKTRKWLADLTGHTGIVVHLAYSPDGKTLASAGYDDRTVRLWDVQTRQTRAVLKGQAASVHAVAFAPDGASLATAGSEGIVRLWNAQAGELLRRFEAEDEITAALAFAPDGRTLTAGTLQNVKRWDLSTGKLIDDFHAHWNEIRCLVFVPGSPQLATAALDGSMRLWNLSRTPFGVRK